MKNSDEYAKRIIKQKIEILRIGLAPVAIFICLELVKTGLPHKQKVYLVDLTDKYEDSAILTDENDHPINIDTENKSKVLALVNEKNTKKNHKYRTIIINEDLKMTTGYMDGKYLDNKILDKVKVNDNALDNVSIVSAKSGTWQREKTKIDNNSKKAKLLENATEVVSSSIPETSSENLREWRESISYDGEKLNVGYIADDYLMNKNYEKASGQRFIVNAPVALKLRTSPNLKSDITDEIPNGEEVLLIPNVSSVTADNCDWFFIAYNKYNKIEFGYVAATYYKKTGPVYYLVNKTKEELIDNSNKHLVLKIVDTGKNSKDPLMLRKKPGTTEEVLTKIVNGTTLYTYEEDVTFCNSSTLIDGHKWLQVHLASGQTGWVASDYLKDEQEEKIANNLNDIFNISFGNEGTKEGYLGIDVNNFTDLDNFEELLANNNNFISTEHGICSNQKPYFVYIKMGATGYGTSNPNIRLAQDNEKCFDNVKSLANICEKYQVPFGFYYYSQAINKDDIIVEADYIKSHLDDIGKMKYNIMPFTIDIEDNGGHARIYKNAKENGTKYQTQVVNTLMNIVREENNINVNLYTDHNALKSVIDFTLLDDINKTDLWLVDPNVSGHSNDIAKNHPEASSSANIRQIKLDTTVETGITLDIDFINSDYYNILIQKLNKDLIKNNSIVNN